MQDLLGPRLILGNPPFTRHQLLTPEEKRLARNAAGSLLDSGLAGLSSYFLAATLHELGADDALCLLLPGNWLETHYGRPLREHLWSLMQRRVEFHVFSNELKLFPGAQVSAMVIAVGPQGRHSEPLVSFRPWLDVDGRVQPSSEHIHDRSKPPPSSFSAAVLFAQGREHKESHDSPSLHRSSSVPERTVALSTFAVVRRGVATGNNAFFMLTDSDANKVPREALRRALMRIGHVQRDILDTAEHDRIGATGRRRWLLDLNDPALRDDPLVCTYIEMGEDEGSDQGVLMSARSFWYIVERVEPPQLLINPMSKSTFRVVENVVGAVPSNSIYGIYLTDHADDEAYTALTEWLRGEDGQSAIQTRTRAHSDGLMKLEPRALGSIAVPASLAEPLIPPWFDREMHRSHAKSSGLWKGTGK